MSDYTNIRYTSPMNNDQLRAAAPSIFAERPWGQMSDRYAFIPTINIVEAMRKEGLVPYSAKQSVSRIEGKTEFTTHLIRFRDTRAASQQLVVGNIYPELVLTNSHDGASRYSLAAGLYRLICGNGMMVSDGEFAALKVMHVGDVSPVLNASFEVVKHFPTIMREVEHWQRVVLNRPQQLALAESALALKYDSDDDGKLHAPIAPGDLLTLRRSDDSFASLWNTHNTIQENLMKGGQRGRAENGRRLRTRPVQAIASDVKLNKALWALSSKMAEMAANN